MTTDLTAVGLFEGIGGFTLALERAGVQVVAGVEIDQGCQATLRRHFPGVALFDDVTEVTGDQLLAAGFVPRRGILTGGFPCQDLSVAGRRAGLGGARSGLFWHVMRLADELSPRWLVLENVPGLLSAVCPCPGGGVCAANGRAAECGEWRAVPAGRSLLIGLRWVRRARKLYQWHPAVGHGIRGGACPGGCMAAHGGAMGTVIGALGERGYGFAARVLDAQFFGLAQRRERVFIVGCLGDWAAPVEVLLEPDSRDGDPAEGAAAGTRVAGTLAASSGSGGLGGIGQSGNAISSRIVETVGTLAGTGPGGGWRVGADEAAVGQLVTVPAAEVDGWATCTWVAFDLDGDGQGGGAVSTLQGGGRRGHRIDAEGAAGGHLVVAVPVQDCVFTGKDQNGLGIGAPGDPAYTLDHTGGQGVIAFDAAQITHPENRVNPKPGDPAPPLASTGQAMLAGPVPVALRGRDAGNQIEAGKPGDPSFAVRGPGGGSSYPMVAHALTGHHNRHDGTVDTMVAHALTSEGADASEDGTGRGTPLVAVPVAWRGRGMEAGTVQVANAVRSGGDGHTGDQMGYVMSLASAGDFSVGQDVAQTVRAAHGQPGNVTAAAAVRRLTPVECERLQGFPDRWTQWDDRGAEQSDSARYRRLGNAVAVPVAGWVAGRLVAADAALEQDGEGAG